MATYEAEAKALAGDSPVALGSSELRKVLLHWQSEPS